MNTINCPNCGAPIIPEKNKCEYCDTSYFDLSTLDIGSNKPFYLKLKYNNMIITQLVKATPNINLTFNSDNKYTYGGIGNQKIASYVLNETLSTNLTFEAVIDPEKKTLCTIQTLNEG